MTVRLDEKQDARLAALEARLTYLEDEKAIREVLARYGFYADAALDDEYFGLFTDDCVMDVSSGRAPDPYRTVRWEGLQQMKDFLAVRSGEQVPNFVGRSMHAQGNNLTVNVDNDVAVANGYSFILHQDGFTTRLLSASVNEWRLIKVDGRWLIRERTRRMLGAPDTATVLTAGAS